MLGYAYHYADLVELAEQAYRRSVELNPSTPRIHWMHGRMLLYVDRAHDAELEMRQAMAASPNQYRVAAFLGELLYYQGKLDEAGQFLKRSVEELAVATVPAHAISPRDRGDCARRTRISPLVISVANRRFWN